MKLQQIIGFLFFIIISLVISSCSEETENFGKYYEGEFNDYITFNYNQDSVNIILEQLGTASIIKQNVPYSIENIQSIGDSITIKMFISFGSYKETPNVVKQINSINDSIYIWYSTRDNPNKVIAKTSNITGIETSPRIDFVSVDSVVIYKPDSISVQFISRVIR